MPSKKKQTKTIKKKKRNTIVTLTINNISKKLGNLFWKQDKSNIPTSPDNRKQNTKNQKKKTKHQTKITKKIK